MIGLLVSGIAFAAQNALDPAGPLAGRINSLTRVMIYLLSAIFIIVMIVLAIAAFGRQRHTTPEPEPHNAVIPPQHDREQRLSHTVTAGVLLSVAILFVL